MKVTFDHHAKCWVMHCSNGPLEIRDVLCTDGELHYVPCGFGAHGPGAVAAAGMDFDECEREWLRFAKRHNHDLRG